MTMADFAKTQLMKFGWTEGKGLGKNENGITEALRPNLKFDTAGIGHKHTDTNAWWESEFNKAAKSINVESRCNGITISSTCEPEQTDVPSNGKDTEEERTGFKQYANFRKTSTLCNGALIHEPGSDFRKVLEKSEEIVHIPLTDEELFKACGGRTAHKGARHGLKLNGKLERIAQQEKELLGNSNCSISANCIDVSLSIKSKKSNKIRSVVRNDVIEELYDDDCETHSNANAILSLQPSEPIFQYSRSKSSRRKQKKRINTLMHQLSMSCNISETDPKCETTISDAIDTKKCLKRKRSKDRRAHTESNVRKDALSEDIDDELSQMSLPLSDETVKGKRKKHKNQKRAMKLESKKTKTKNIEENDINCSTHIENEEEFILPSKKAKRIHKKVVDLAGKLNTFSFNEEEADKVDSKKSKKKNKKKENDHKLKSKVSKKDKGHHNKEAIKLERLTNNLMSKRCFSTEAGKNWKTAKTEKKLDSIVKNLMAVNLTENVSDSITSNTKKKNKQKKKSKNKSKDKDVNSEIVI